MKLGAAILLGTLQGLTEWLPVSSTAHLALARSAGAGEPPSDGLDVALHLGSAAALLISERRALIAPPWSLATDLRRRGLSLHAYAPESISALRVALATLPAVAAGSILPATALARARRPGPMAALLTTGSLLMAVATQRRPTTSEGARTPVTARQALIIGAAQALALLPGVSRSGATISAGILTGLEQGEAQEFATLLAAPVMVAATVRSLPSLRSAARSEGVGVLAAGVLAAGGGGLLGARIGPPLLRRRGLAPFVVYRLALALALTALSRWRKQRTNRPNG